MVVSQLHHSEAAEHTITVRGVFQEHMDRGGRSIVAHEPRRFGRSMCTTAILICTESLFKKFEDRQLGRVSASNEPRERTVRLTPKGSMSADRAAGVADSGSKKYLERRHSPHAHEWPSRDWRACSST